MALLGNIRGFVFGQAADKLLEKYREKAERNALEQHIEAFAAQYYEKQFSQVPLDQEFDFGGLNGFLCEHLEDEVAACFNAPSARERSFFKGQLLEKAYEYAAAATCERRNAVYAYVQSILAIIEEFFIERVDDKSWFLAGRVVDDIQAIVQKLLADRSAEIMRFIAYHGSFADMVDSVAHPVDTSNPYHFLNKNIRFQGRQDDLAYLDGFLADPAPLLFAVVTGQGGAGKSKLMHHYMLRETGNLEWKIVFPNQAQIERFAERHTEWNYPKNLLVIIDYVGQQPEIVGRWISLLNGTTQAKRPPRMRIVMLERQGIESNPQKAEGTPPWYEQMRKAGGHNFEALLYQQQFRALGPLTQEDLLVLVGNIAENQGKSLPENTKRDILAHARKMGGDLGADRFAIPLILILLTDAVLGGSPLGQLNPARLMEYIIKKHRVHWLNVLCGGKEERFHHLEMLLAYATATGGWELQPLPPPLAEASAGLLRGGRAALQAVLSGVSETATQGDTLPPLEPDIVGEYFVLDFLFEHAVDPEFFGALVALLWSTPKKFAYFLDRSIQSYLCDSKFACLVEGSSSLFRFADAKSAYWQAILLVNVTAKLPPERRKGIVGKFELEALANDELYRDNKKTVLEDAKGIVDLTYDKRDVADAAATVDRLEALAKDARYSDNQDIVLRYANGLYNFASKQDTADRAITDRKSTRLNSSH